MKNSIFFVIAFITSALLSHDGYAGVTDITIGETIQRVNGVVGSEYESVPDEELSGIIQFLVDTNSFSDSVFTRTVEMDGEIDDDFVYIPANSTDHPVFLSDAYTTVNPIATRYSCCFSITGTLFTDEHHDGLCMLFLADIGAPGP